MTYTILSTGVPTDGKRGSSFTHGLLSLPKSGVLASRYLPEPVPYLGEKNKKIVVGEQRRKRQGKIKEREKERETEQERGGREGEGEREPREQVAKLPKVDQ